MKRRLAAILAADVVGYSRLIRNDEAGTLKAVKAHREHLIEPIVSVRNGRIVKLMGDGLLIEFASAVEAVRCAIEMQHFIGAKNKELSEDSQVRYRIGINVGDIVLVPHFGRSCRAQRMPASRPSCRNVLVAASVKWALSTYPTILSATKAPGKAQNSTL